MFSGEELQPGSGVIFEIDDKLTLQDAVSEDDKDGPEHTRDSEEDPALEVVECKTRDYVVSTKEHSKITAFDAPPGAIPFLSAGFLGIHELFKESGNHYNHYLPHIRCVREPA